ncbi:sulfotransferase [Nitrosococcus wardiae]|uniref:Sulfotransferase n=2 Tax=Nitrosococcus wardiae TaxID=1814290 RepID=A0A4P7C1Z2_9GAMM|nr:sulfotransferase [Nitrosococcus wardiae]
MDWLGYLAHKRPGFWIRAGNFETSVLEDRIASTQVQAPIYISGLARSGSTILLEILARHPDCATHAYKDFPLVLTPYFWSWFLDRSRRVDEVKVERAHGDGITVTPDSPEAIEEPVWMAFFPELHNPLRSNVLNAHIEAPAFERFYRNHIRKILWLRHSTRYLAKGNYNVTRLEYLLKLFPDAHFVIPVREPAAHIASLMRQHQHFHALHCKNPRALRYMQRVGHYEFGLDRRPIHIGEDSQASAILQDWIEGREVEGFARLWSDVHLYIAQRLDATPALREAALIVRHEDLCAAPREQLRKLFAHCHLPINETTLEHAAARLRGGSAPSLADEDLAMIRRLTHEAAMYFGYDMAAADGLRQTG